MRGREGSYVTWDSWQCSPQEPQTNKTPSTRHEKPQVVGQSSLNYS